MGDRAANSLCATLRARGGDCACCALVCSLLSLNLCQQLAPGPPCASSARASSANTNPFTRPDALYTAPPLRPPHHAAAAARYTDIASVGPGGALYMEFIPDRLLFDGFVGDRVDPVPCLGTTVGEQRPRTTRAHWHVPRWSRWLRSLLVWRSCAKRRQTSPVPGWPARRQRATQASCTRSAHLEHTPRGPPSTRAHPSVPVPLSPDKPEDALRTCDPATRQAIPPAMQSLKLELASDASAVSVALPFCMPAAGPALVGVQLLNPGACGADAEITYLKDSYGLTNPPKPSRGQQVLLTETTTPAG